MTIESIQSIGNGIAATVGFFDGVHLGHLNLIEQLAKIADERNLKSMVVTFPEHPRQVLQTDYKPLLLSTPEDKIEKLEHTVADICFPLHFTQKLSQMNARTFMESFLQKRLGVKTLLVGHDHHFGCEKGTNIEDYKVIGNEIGMEVIGATALLYDSSPISSSRIRRALANGSIEKANEMLGYQYSISGTVVHGLQNGRKMGFPTANLGPYCDLMQIPANGVYAAIATVEGKNYPAMLNIGFRPTFNGEGNRTIEAHIIDFSKDIYFQPLTLQFVSYIRAEKRFCSPSELALQLAKDKETAREIIKSKIEL